MKQILVRVLWETMSILREVVTDLVGVSGSRDLTLTPFAENQLSESGLSKDTVIEVFYHGQVKPNDKYVLYKQYSGYRVYITYQYDRKTGKPKILTVNKWTPKK